MTRLLFLLLLFLAAPSARADWQLLSEPGAIALMRHAEAPGTFDPPGFRLDDCATQRNLSDAGRAQARAVGEAIRRLSLRIDGVLTSQWCRCRETAELLGLGPVEDFPALNSLRGPGADQDLQTVAVMRLLDRRAGQRLVLVTHQFNITALTGRPAASGEIVVVRRHGDGLRVLGSIRP